MAFTKIAAAGIGSTGTVTLQNIIVTGSVNTPSITGAASTENVKTNSLVVSGVTTSSGGFVGNVTGNATGLSGTPNITVGSIIASSATISGNVSVAGTVTYEDVTNVDSVGVITARSSVVVGAGLSVVGVTTLASAGGITTAGGTLFAKQLNISGVSTFGNTVVVGGATTQLIVNGNARITGILTVGTSSLTFDGNSNTITGLSTISGSSNLAKPNLAGISSTISSTAVDVFVYDTRKDSDGGQWRKRTQHTSWYNETLNTATRGSRRDIPAVAVIVRESGYLKIYDGDDPDLPMWMVFEANNNTSTSYLLEYFTTGGTSVSALNGVITSGHNSNGATTINFISEKSIRYRLTAESGTYDILASIADRNTFVTFTFAPYANTIGLVNSAVNDVSMTVLPNAPIDSATGLPVPTIAVATSGGTSIIRDDGTVANITYTNFNVANLVHFTKDNKIAILTDGATGGARFYRIYDIPTSNLDGGAYNNMGSALRAYNGDTVSYNYPIRYHINISSDFASSNFYANALVYAKDGPVFGRNGRGIALISEGHTNLPGETIPILSTSAGMVCGISSSVNTGWMHGDIKGAWLSDTSTASVTGTNLVTNGDFASGTTGWTAGSGGTISVTSGVLRVTNTATNGRAISNTFATVVGQRYILTADGVTKTTSNYYMEVRGPEQSATWSSGTGSLYFTAVGTTTYVELYAIGSGVTYSEYDNVSVRIAEPDRSVNNNGLAVYGTITKSVVATGSNLVGYSGFSGSNYLGQPYNSNLAFGTGDFCYMGWAKATTAGGYLFQWDNPNSTNGIRISFLNSTTVRLTVTSVVDRDITYSALTGTWKFIVVRRSGSVITTFIDGIQIDSFSNSTNLSGTDKVLTLGINGNSTLNLALWRISASVPSPTQIAKIYNDEKALFQPNSQCTLYGSSDAVTALAYDDTTKLLSAGTSSGRSDFQGLERINNTTTAVTTAISASNGLIAEQ